MFPLTGLVRFAGSVMGISFWKLGVGVELVEGMDTYMPRHYMLDSGIISSVVVSFALLSIVLLHGPKAKVMAYI